MSSTKQHNSNEDWKLLAPTLAALPKLSIEDSFRIPEAYFSSLETAVMQHPLVKPANNFNVPVAYFEHLSEIISQHALISKQSPFSVPENYFEQVASKVAQRAGISSVSNSMEVPEGYFENLPLKIQDKLYRQKQEAKIYWLPQIPVYRVALVAAAISMIVVMVYLMRMFDTPVEKINQLAMNKIQESAISAATDDIHEFDESLLIDEIDQPEQIKIENHDEQSQIKTEITEYLLENDITVDEITEEI